MIDEEDNQSLIDEIQALEDVLDSNKSVNNYKSILSNNTSNANTFSKLEAKLQREQFQRIDSADENDLVTNDVYKNYDCKDLQDLLELNKNLIELITTAHNKMVILLEDCRRKQSMIAEQISNKCTLSTHSKIISFNAGMPYFKDKNYYTPKRNEDTETKMKNGELRLSELQRIHRWNQFDKSSLLKAIRHEVTLTLLNKKEEEENYIDNSITKTSQLPVDVKEAIGSLGSMKFDWLKIANNIPENKHNAEECEVMWNVFLHPSINKQKWTPQEDKNLNRTVEKFNFENWDLIASELNTKRSGYQCFIRYNTNNWKNIMKGQQWLPSDDRQLKYLIQKLKIGDYIPWGYISSFMSNWTKQQVYFRWNYSLAPHLKKGRFSHEEDRMLLNAVEKYGPNFSKISALVMNNRTNIQLKEHYQTLTARGQESKKIWTFEDDDLLLNLHKKYGSNWAKIVKYIPNVSRVQARQRYSCLIRYQKKGVDIKRINRCKSPASTHTTVTYTSNTPWSRENQEIFIKHYKIDDQLINFFKKENAEKKLQERKSYHPDKLKQDTKKLYNLLLKLNANINIPDNVEDYIFELNEMTQELIKALQNYIKNRKTNLNEDIECIRLKMFGPQETISEKRFIPPLPFGFCSPKYQAKNYSSIDLKLNVNEFHQTKLITESQLDKSISEYLGQDIEAEFEKLKKVLTDETDSKKMYSIKCKPFANSMFFPEEVENASNMMEKSQYDWELNRMVSNSLPKEKSVFEEIPVLMIEPNRTTLQMYQELLLISRFTSDSSEENVNHKLTLRGRGALSLFKRRYEQLFHIPTGLSRIIPTEIVDISDLLSTLEKSQKKSFKKKNSQNIIKVVNTQYLSSD